MNWNMTGSRNFIDYRTTSNLINQILTEFRELQAELIHVRTLHLLLLAQLAEHPKIGCSISRRLTIQTTEELVHDDVQ